MTHESQFLGIVQDGMFQLLMPEPAPTGTPRFTSIRPQEARSPESGELVLSAYEGSAIMIRGDDHGGWIYAAQVADTAGPILTAVVRKLFVHTP